MTLSPDGRENHIAIEGIRVYGRCFAEYLEMFGLTTEELVGRTVLDCPAGGASFAAEARTKGVDVTAVDPVFSLQEDELRRRAEGDIDHVVAQVRRNHHLYRWGAMYANPEELIRSRRESLEGFLQDRKQNPGKYVAAALPSVPLKGGQFDCVLSSNLLFLYHDRLPNAFQFHRGSIYELNRLSRSGEVRCFPVVGLDLKVYPELDRLRTLLHGEGIESELRSVPYSFVPQMNEMIVFRRNMARAEGVLPQA